MPCRLLFWLLVNSALDLLALIYKHHIQAQKEGGYEKIDNIGVFINILLIFPLTPDVLQNAAICPCQE